MCCAESDSSPGATSVSSAVTVTSCCTVPGSFVSTSSRARAGVLGDCERAGGGQLAGGNQRFVDRRVVGRVDLKLMVEDRAGAGVLQDREDNGDKLFEIVADVVENLGAHAVVA